MQSIFSSNSDVTQQTCTAPAPPVLRWIAYLLVTILALVSWAVYRYSRELSRQYDERCRQAHAALMASGVYGESTKQIKEACGTDALTPEEQITYANKKAEIEGSIREFNCRDALEKYGVESEVTKQHCPGTEAGKKAGF